MTTNITVNLSYFNQESVLIDHINLWKDYSKRTKKEISFCIVDDCSKFPADKVLSHINLSDLDIHIYRVTDDLYCNIAGVRNLAATVCNTEWMLMLDMDTMVSEKTLRAMLLYASTSSFGCCLKFNRRVPSDKKHVKNNQIHPAVCLLRKDDYWDVGGCEEDLVGYYGYTDPSFWYRAKEKLSIEERYDLYLDYIPNGEANIIRNTSRNSSIFKYKKKTDTWSNDYLRFNWIKVY